MKPKVTIAHVVHRFDIGGLENGVVNLINRLGDGYSHQVIALTECNPGFCRRISHSNVQYHALHKREGQDWRMLWRLYRLLRKLGPDIVHTRNLATLEAAGVAWLAGVPLRVHGEHGWDMTDLDGSNARYQRLRRLMAPLIHRFVALSSQGVAYLVDNVGVPRRKVVRIINGVDVERFQAGHDRGRLPDGFAPEGTVVLGSVGRIAEVKNHVALARAFVLAHRLAPAQMAVARLVIVGDGPQRGAVEAILTGAGLTDRLHLAGAQSDIPAWMRSFDLFVLPSLAEGISNTILEAMAVGLPVVATQVGGNDELVAPGETGVLVPAGDDSALANALIEVVSDRELRARQGINARQRAEHAFSLQTMVERYAALYQDLVVARG